FAQDYKVHLLKFSSPTESQVYVSRSLGFSTELALGQSVDYQLTLYDWPLFHAWQGKNPRIFVNAAGNGYLFNFLREGHWDYQGIIQVPIIFVASVLADGEYDPYSGGGHKVLVSAPGGDDQNAVTLPGSET